MRSHVDAVREYEYSFGGLPISIGLPPVLAPAFEARVRGVSGSTPGPPAVSYAVTLDGGDRFGLERDHGAVRHNLDAEGLLETLVHEVAEVVHRRSPDLIVARGGAVEWQGHGVVVLGGSETSSSELVRMLCDEGAALLSDGLVVCDRVGRVRPVVVGAPGTEPEGVDDRGLGVAISMLVVASTPGEAGDWYPIEVEGTRAVLPLLEHVAPNHQRAPATRGLLRTLAPRVLLLRGAPPADRTVAADIVARTSRQPPIVLDDASAAPSDEPPHPASVPQPAPHLRFDDFLPPDEHSRLLEATLAKEEEFVPSRVITAEPVGDLAEIRRSLTSYALDDVWDLFEHRLVRLLPHIRRELGIDWFELDHIERQLTVHGDGDHFTLHVDDGGPAVAQRQISAVYYFNRTPQRYTGGQLRLFDSLDVDGHREPAGTFTELEPSDNTLVVFRSDAHHEVRPVHVPGNAFADRRFTIVCWARRARTAAEVFVGPPDELATRQRDLLPGLTTDGYRVVPTPAAAQQRLAAVFTEGAQTAPGETPDTGVLPTGTPSLLDLGGLRAALLDELRPLHEEWYGAPLVPSALYGMRIYRDGQTLRRHADRVETHIISSIVHVAADVDEPWPLVVEDRHGVEHEVLLEPGQMLLYEGARLPHSRPHPLRGRHYASVFVHYRPVDWSRTLSRIAKDA